MFPKITFWLLLSFEFSFPPTSPPSFFLLPLLCSLIRYASVVFSIKPTRDARERIRYKLLFLIRFVDGHLNFLTSPFFCMCLLIWFSYVFEKIWSSVKSMRSTCKDKRRRRIYLVLASRSSKKFSRDAEEEIIRLLQSITNMAITVLVNAQVLLFPWESISFIFILFLNVFICLCESLWWNLLPGASEGDGRCSRMV